VKRIVLMLTVILCAISCAHHNEIANKSQTSEAEAASLKSYIQDLANEREAGFDIPKPQELILDNGLIVLVIERHDLPMVYVHAQIRGGSIYDPPGKEGLAYLTGWLLTEGSESYSSDEIDQVMDAHGAKMSSQAYNESCIATLTSLKKDFKSMFPYFADILTKPAFRSENLEEARSYLTGTILRDKNNLENQCYLRFRKDVFGDHPYSKPQKGTIDSVQSIKPDDLVNFYSKYYHPDHAALVFVGDINAKEAFSTAQHYLGSWPHSRELLPEISRPRDISGIHINLMDAPSVQAQIALGHIGIDKTSKDRFKIITLNQILGNGSITSRLGEEVRVKRGLTYGIYSSFVQREFTGEFAVVTSTKIESCGETIRVILDALSNIRTNLISEQELLDAKQSLINQFPLLFEQYEDIASELVHLKFYHLPMTDLTDYAKQIQGITREDILETAQKYLHPDKIMITIVGPKLTLMSQLATIADVTLVEGD
jgi:zinc protease